MRQALHIFLKDSRQFRYPVAVMLAWTAAFAAVGAQPWPASPSAQTAWWTLNVMEIAKVLFPIGWCYLIAQVCHADALPGERQFWLTRPYDRGSLVAAKAIFVLAYVALPLMIAQAAIVILNGLPLTPHLPGLVWEQVLFTAIVVLPAAAIAAITSTLAQFVVAAVIPAVLFLFSSQVTYLRPWGGLEWIRTSVAVCAIVAIASAMLVVQFRRRRTATSRLIALSGTLVALAVLPLLPWRPAFALQAQLADPWDGTLTAELRPPEPRRSPGLVPVTRGIELNFRVVGPPDNPPIVCEAREITIERGAEPIWRTGLRVGQQGIRLGGGCWMGLVMPAPFLDSVGDVPLTLRAVLYITVFGPEHSTRVPIGQPPTAIPHAGWCAGASDEKSTFVDCRVAFREPRQLVELQKRGTVWSRAGQAYSPFPADLRLQPVDHRGFGLPPLLDAVTITTREPVAHVRTTVEAKDVRLRDFEFR